MFSQSVHVLMTGAGAPGGPGILQCLKREKRLTITVSDADPSASGRFLHDRFLLTTRGGEEGYAEQLLQACLREGIQAVLPLTTAELLPLADAAPLFKEAGIKVLTAEASILRIANNKSATYRHLQEKGLHLPRFRTVSSLEDFRKALDELGYPEHPLCFKPSVGNGSRGFRRLSEKGPDVEEVFGKKPEAFSLSRSGAEALLATGPFPELLVAEYVEGREYSVDCLVLPGAEPVIIPRLREKMSGGITVRGTFEKNEAVIQYCRSILEALPLEGISGIQVRIDGSGRPQLIEINPRVQGTVAAGLGAGVNLPLLLVAAAFGMPIAPEEKTVAWGTRFTRYWAEVFY